jgi:hypothetical protein
LQIDCIFFFIDRVDNVLHECVDVQALKVLSSKRIGAVWQGQRNTKATRSVLELRNIPRMALGLYSTDNSIFVAQVRIE